MDEANDEAKPVEAVVQLLSATVERTLRAFGFAGFSSLGIDKMFSMGVTPPRGSLTNTPNFSESAPANLPSM